MVEYSCRAYIADMQDRIREAVPLPERRGNFALLDFPDIRNVGDSAIWLGERAFFEAQDAGRPAYVSAMRDLDADALERAVPAGPIYLHGGGNFGDIWPGHQRFRERVLRQFAHRQIVQLPQSLHFTQPETIAASARAIAEHGNFILLVRDRPSYEFAQEHFACDTRLCPDMAFAIGPVAAPRRPLVGALAMLRQDKEGVERDLSHRADDILFDDWIDEPAVPVRIAKTIGALRGAMSGNANLMRLEKYDAAARQRFARGVYQLSRARSVVTDRLHVHIVSLLLGREHGVLDNSYGKIGRFRDAFPEPEGLTHSFTELESALAWARARASGA